MLVYHFVFSACLSSLTPKFTALSVLFIFQRWSPLSAVESHPGAQNTKARRRLITFRVRIFWEGLIETSVNGIHCEQSLFSSLMNMCMCLLFIASISSGEWNSSSFYSSSYHQHLVGFPSLMFSCAWVLFSLNHGLSFCSIFVPTCNFFFLCCMHTLISRGLSWYLLLWACACEAGICLCGMSESARERACCRR